MIKKLINLFLYKKRKWLIPVIVMILVFHLINHFLTNEGFKPFGYVIFN